MNKHAHTAFRSPLLAAAAAALLLGACGRVPVQESPAVSFTLPACPPTKATPYTGASSTPGQVAMPTDVSLGVVSYTRSGGTGNWSPYTTPSVIRADCDLVRTGESGSASGKWLPSPRILWPAAGTDIRYFGYAPFVDGDDDGTDDHVAVTASVAAEPAPVISFTVPDECADQIDLLVTDEASSSRAYAGDPPVTAIDVPLGFVHALTGIRFRVPEGFSISQISVSDVYGSGTLTLGGSTLSWSPDKSSTGSYSIASPTLKTDPTDGRYLIVDDQYTLLLLPQTLEGDALISVTCSDGTVTRTVNAYLEGLVWRPGRLIVYTVAMADSDPTLRFQEFYGMSQDHENIDISQSWD